jgi:osomolarity two-component system phosphorelay intermediate protein YPD1
MSHAFQSTATGVSVIIDNLQRAHHTDIVQGRTYQISKLPELDYAINVKIFREILELDDEDEQYFTRSLVCDYFTLAQRTFAEMDACLSVHDSNLLL